MAIRPFARPDAPALARLAAACAGGERDFVLNPLWESEGEFLADFERFGTPPERAVRVAAEAGAVVGLAGFLRRPGAAAARLLCPIVAPEARGRGLGGALLRAALELGARELGVAAATAALGTRNRAGHALLASHGFRPTRQHFLLRCEARPEPARAALRGAVFEAAKPSDAEAIAALHQACGFGPRSPEAVRAALCDGRIEFALAREEERAVGFAEVDAFWPRRVWVASLGVESGWRDRGLGSQLLAWALARRFEAGAASALLLLSPDNRAALRACEKAGFRRHRVIDVLEKRLP
jgi:ribosomal protein S18 acetylase RimI-like enzyme